MLDRVSHYRIVSRIGAGGMGEVYRAVDERLGRDVAVKLLKPTGSSTERQLRMLREAQAASALNHPGIVTIHDVGTHEGRPYLVMELVQGRRFSELADGAMAPREALRLCAEAADALAAAHGRGILHRDVKSDNLMLLPDGRVKVLDFGLAKLAAGASGTGSGTESGKRTEAEAGAGGETLASGGWNLPTEAALAVTLPGGTPASGVGSAPGAAAASDLTKIGDVIGTPAYMAPEQAQALPALPQSEIFSLGVVLYELLVGRRPFLGATVVETLELVKMARFTPASQAAGRPLGRGVDAIIARALAREPGDRFPDMRAFAAALRAEAARLDPRRARRRLAALGAGLLAAGAGGLLVAGARRHVLGVHPPRVVVSAVGSPALRAVDVRPLTRADGCEEFPTFTPDGRTIIYDGTAGEDFHLFAIDAAAGGEPRELTRGKVWDLAPAVSPDGRSLAFARKVEGVTATYLTDVGATAPLRKLAVGRVRPTWSPDGAAVWAGDAARPGRIDVVTGAVERTLEVPAGNIAIFVRELADGRAVALLYPADAPTYGNGLGLFDARGRFVRWLIQQETEEVLALTPAQDAVYTVRLTSAGDRELWWVPLDGREPAPLAGNEVAPRKGLAVLPSGLIAWSDCRSIIGLAAVEGTRLVPLPGGDWADIQPAAIPGTDKLLVISDRGATVQIWVVDRTRREQPRPLDLPRGVEPISYAVSNDGSMVAVATSGHGLLVAPVAGGPATKILDVNDDLAPAFSRDGTRVFVDEPLPDGRRRLASVPVGGGALTPVLGPDTGLAAPSPRDDTLIYVASPGDAGLPMIRRPGARPVPLADDLRPGPWRQARWAADGKLVALQRADTELFVVDPSARRVVRRIASGADALLGVTWLADELIVGRQSWQGDLWIATTEIGDRPRGLK